MRRQKMYRFEQNRLAPNVIERGKPLYSTIKGKWHPDYFQNDNPIVLELGCGKGEYTVGLASAYPDKNFIGVDIKGDRIARGSQAALAGDLANVAFLRTDIQYLDEFLAEGEVSEIWITFPDPQPRDKQEKHRLTYKTFLAKYATLLQPGGVLHLKTDNTPFYEYSLESLPANGFTILEATDNLYESPLNNLHLGIKTKYEAMFFEKGFSIKYLQSKKNG
ncbi:tRNA (guanine-N(7)-)-methyltransferase [Fibrella aestuarina BUZ 2]|uniref:tRNA (guanine-N(7)-)-methyltransferase n=1 Tax=Fibrella aestuarina BUZ 2 TaxID=1166018 RepID=I0KAM2_9BACT|nr:tRNA (guanosine(46)-N7)-methyltransferase TrmB [Fibrella aestuarina]CCH01175.1 tRNA (guanine-N(7)-)-methyltransferase [Fibrella aestuarina BUZ 2]